MKEKAFNDYVEKVTDLFKISHEDLFAKSKRRDIVDARHLLYYLCFNRPMQIRYIQEYMERSGYKVGHSTIIHGIDQVKDKVNEDVDYKEITQTILA